MISILGAAPDRGFVVERSSPSRRIAWYGEHAEMKRSMRASRGREPRARISLSTPEELEAKREDARTGSRLMLRLLVEETRCWDSR